MKTRKSNRMKDGTMSLNQLMILMCLVLALVSISKPVHAVPLTGNALDFYHSFNGTLGAVELDLGWGPVSTGEISYSLDLTNPSAQTFTFDFNAMIASAEIDFIVDFPLLHTLGESPLEIHISESGPIVSGVPDLPIGDDILNFRALLSGGGTVAPGSILSGFVFSNLNDTNVTKNVHVEAGGTFNQNIEGGGNINVTIEADISGAGQTVTTGGIGVATIATNPVPEPCTMLLLGSGLAGIIGFGRKRLFKKA